MVTRNEVAKPVGVSGCIFLLMDKQRKTIQMIPSQLIMGAGPIGLGILAMSKIVPGENFPVLISDVIPYRLDPATRLGGFPIARLKEAFEMFLSGQTGKVVVEQ